MKISNRLKELREMKNLTQEELGSKLGVSRQTIISIEKAKYTPSLLLALQISDFFEMPLEKIFKLD